MTILIGVKCTDGVVIGADSIATSAMGLAPLINIQSNEKLQLVGPKCILATTGAVGLGQRVKLIADKMWSEKKFAGDGMSSATQLAGRVLNDFSASGVQRHPQHGIGFGALLAMTVDGKPYLVEFGTTDFQPEIKDGRLFFVSIGSGQVLADPFLAFIHRVLWKNTMPTVETAKIGVFWALYHTIALAPGGVGGAPKLGVLGKKGIDWSASISDDTQEQAQYIQELESRISLSKPFSDAATSAPPKLSQ